MKSFSFATIIIIGPRGIDSGTQLNVHLRCTRFFNLCACGYYIIQYAHLLYKLMRHGIYEFSLSRQSRCTIPPSSAGNTVAAGATRARRAAHARRENKTPPPPRERISRYAALPYSPLEKGTDRKTGWTKMKNPSSVGTQEVAAGTAAVAASSDGNQSRSTNF